MTAIPDPVPTLPVVPLLLRFSPVRSVRPRVRPCPELPAELDGCSTLEGSAKSGPPGVNWTAASAPQLLLATGIVAAAAPPVTPVEVPDMVAVAKLRLGDEEPPLDNAWCSAC